MASNLASLVKFGWTNAAGLAVTCQCGEKKECKNVTDHEPRRVTYTLADIDRCAEIPFISYCSSRVGKHGSNVETNRL